MPARRVRNPRPCWKCGGEHYLKGDYCLTCLSHPDGDIWMECTGCERVRRRDLPGRTKFLCGECARTINKETAR